MLRRVALVRPDVSEEFSASIIRVTRIGELGTTLAVTSQKTQFFIVTALKTSNLTCKNHLQRKDVG
jgi:demethoxyubiquinone hydroxylase (CLK1/Coq7/Cat5 family)